jgi:hypothetical protein
MFHGVKKKVDVVRMMTDLTAAKVELLSAQCATDRVRLQYSPQDIVAFAEPQTLKRAIASAEALYRYFSQLEAHVQQQEQGGGSASR